MVNSRSSASNSTPKRDRVTSVRICSDCNARFDDYRQFVNHNRKHKVRATKSTANADTDNEAAFQESTASNVGDDSVSESEEPAADNADSDVEMEDASYSGDGKVLYI